jgi:hypothetical protein
MYHIRKPKKIPKTSLPIWSSVGWVLAYAPDRDRPEWRNFNLYLTHPGVKTIYWLGWNFVEQRFADGSDFRILRKYNPEIAEWVEDEIKDWVEIFG